MPTSIDVERMDDKITVRFRVSNVYRGAYINVYVDGERIWHQKKRVMAPGEMEQVIIQKAQLNANTRV